MASVQMTQKLVLASTIFFLFCKTFYTMHGKVKHNDRAPLLKYFNITIDTYTAAPYLLAQPYTSKQNSQHYFL
jgi:hypothetical protein